LASPPPPPHIFAIRFLDERRALLQYSILANTISLDNSLQLVRLQIVNVFRDKLLAPTTTVLQFPDRSTSIPRYPGICDFQAQNGDGFQIKV